MAMASAQHMYIVNPSLLQFTDSIHQFLSTDPLHPRSSWRSIASLLAFLQDQDISSPESPRRIPSRKQRSVADDMHPLQRFMMPTAAQRAKRATAPLDAAARARITVRPSSVDSSGSEHEAAALSSLVNEYLFETDATVPSAALLTVDQDSDGEKRTCSSSSAADVAEEIKGILDPTRRSGELCPGLIVDVMEAVSGLHEIRPNQPVFRRAVMSRLRERGHDAGLCKVRWAKSSRMAAGSYEYIDVVVSAETRFIVDVGFASEFEVARPTAEFEAVRVALPEVLVAPAGDVRRVVKAASAAARRSLKSHGLSVPPWRKRRYMMAKWFGPYRRTVNPVPVSAAAAMTSSAARAAIWGTIHGFALPPPTAISSGFWS